MEGDDGKGLKRQPAVVYTYTHIAHERRKEQTNQQREECISEKENQQHRQRPFSQEIDRFDYYFNLRDLIQSNQTNQICPLFPFLVFGFASRSRSCCRECVCVEYDACCVYVKIFPSPLPSLSVFRLLIQSVRLSVRPCPNPPNPLTPQTPKPPKPLNPQSPLKTPQCFFSPCSVTLAWYCALATYGL